VRNKGDGSTTNLLHHVLKIATHPKGMEGGAFLAIMLPSVFSGAVYIIWISKYRKKIKSAVKLSFVLLSQSDLKRGNYAALTEGMPSFIRII
jgi:hypothetical protein